MARPVARVLISFAALAGLSLAITVVWTLTRPLPPPPPMPNPNGYDDFLNAARLVEGDVADWATLDREQLRALAQRNSEALKFARTGLSRECRVPLDNHSLADEAHLNDLSKFKRLAQALAVEARLAELDDHPGSAAKTHLEMIRLGQAISRGGVIIDALVGVAIESMAALEKVIPKLDARQCRELASELERAEAQRESIQALLDQERAWARRTYGLKAVLLRQLLSSSLKQTIQRTTSRIQAQQARTGRLIVEAATRAYELENGHPPEGFADLVPGYLKVIPKDPVTGTNISYRPGTGSQ